MTALLSLALGACGAQPVPRVAFVGTSIFLPVPANAFGSTVANGSQRIDYQRGDLVVALCPAGASAFCATPAFYLDTVYVASTYPDPASPAGLRGYLQIYGMPSITRGFDGGQNLALVNIPMNVTPNTYELSVRRRVRVPSQSPTEIVEPYQYGWPITIKPAPPEAPAYSSASAAWWNWSLGTQDLADLIPYPTVVVRPASEDISNPELWAAGEITVTYNPAIVAIKGAFEDRHLGRASIVRTRNDPVAGTLRISFVDPDRCTVGIRIAYDLVNGAVSGSINPQSVFSVAPGTRVYDINGSVQTGASPYTIGESDFLNYQPGCAGVARPAL